ncbi:MAG: 4-hydroxythreonine-4-phosphate dehydrogenase PdxA [Paracoccus sp. (in: a-proteobacteria)]|nr:4-hydroxythreonine-4-phosphate dehydrogenase PdxA [Paracoccus sp. (in: a-proteobacteria)]
MTAPLPLIAVTCGEPAGIGPDLAPHLAGLALPARPVWIGDARHLPSGRHAVIGSIAEAQEVQGDALAVLHRDFGAKRQPGTPQPSHAKPVIAAIEEAARLAMAGEVAAICTMPINKKALKDGAGFAFPGHTEMLAELAGGVDVAMMLASSSVSPPLRVVPATIHIALADVPAALTEAVLSRAIRIVHAALIRDFGVSAPRLAVAGLNPHAGEGGVMGREEVDWIAPLLTRLRAEGIEIAGPLPADTMFHAPARARYDAAICAYHDQALIPIKTLDFAGGVNVTLGLPFIRSSPDHGTAFDIAGTGAADPSSAIAALRMAAEMAQRRAS